MRGFATIDEIEFFERTPLGERLSVTTTHAALAEAAARFGAAPAIKVGDDPARTVSYADLLRRVNGVARLFHELGVGRGDTVATLLPNLPQAHDVTWGAQAVGMVGPINPFLAPSAVADLLGAGGARLLVTTAPRLDAELWAKAKAVADRVEAILTIGGLPSEGERRGLRVVDFDAEVTRRRGDALPDGVTPNPDDVCALFHTGGTTGTPKLARQTHFNQTFDAWACTVAADFRAGDAVLVGMPMFHVNAVVMQGLAQFMAGATAVLVAPSGYRDRAVMANFWRLVERHRATSIVAVPTILAALLEVPLDGADIGSLRQAIVGGAPMPVEICHRFEARTGLRVLEAYGLSEATALSSINPVRGARRIGSIGLRYPYQEMKVAKLAADGRIERDCAVDEIGSVLLRGPNVGPGYRQAELNAKLFTRDGWLDSGDLGRQDAEGYFWLAGRAKDVIIRGGHNIDPLMIEEALNAHPAVQMAAAVGRPDSHAGELPVAYVALRPGAVATSEDLLAHARAHIPERAAVPVEVVILDALPVTAVGKTFKPALRHDAVGRVVSALLTPLFGAKALRITVEADPVGGTVVLIVPEGVAAPDWAARVRQALGGLALHLRLSDAAAR